MAGHNFGCGSSREHAVWTLCEAGFRAVVAKSFADIFRNNAARNGLLVVELAEASIDRLLGYALEEALALTVDLERQVVDTPHGEHLGFSYDPFRRHCLLHGLDDLEYLRKYQGEIDLFKSRQEVALPRLAAFCREERE